MSKKGIKLKKGVDVIEKWMTDFHLPFEEYLKRDFKIMLYHEELDFHYETTFNWSKPFDYIESRIKPPNTLSYMMENIKVNTLEELLRGNYNNHITLGEVSDKDNELMKISFHIWLKGYGKKLIENLYNEIGSSPSVNLIENEEDYTDVVLRIKKGEDGIHYIQVSLKEDEGEGTYNDGKKEIDLPMGDDGNLNGMGTIIHYSTGSVYSQTGLSKEKLDDIGQTINVMEKIKRWDYEIGKNDKCPCESGLIYKNCCMN